MSPLMTSIAELVPPPRVPVGLDLSWDEVEREVGLALPGDYKSFVDAYGSGKIISQNGWLDVWNFRDASLGHPLQELLCGKGSVVSLYRKILALGYEWPYPLYPQSGGLLPFAAVNDVNHLNWLTRGLADTWDLVYFAFDEFDEVDLLEGDTFTRFLLKALNKGYDRPVDPGLDHPFAFQPDAGPRG